jgi:hypothetical protein
VTNGVRYSRAAIVTLDWTIWAQALGHGTSDKKAELIVLTQVLRYGKDKIINVYTESPYALTMAHVHGVLTGIEASLLLRVKILKMLRKS